MHQTTVTIHLYHDGPTAGMLDCWVTPPDGATESFDPLQLPDEFKNTMEPVVIAALADKAALSTEVANLKAEAEAKDANIQEMLDQVEQMKSQVAKAEARIAELAVFEAMAG